MDQTSLLFIEVSLLWAALLFHGLATILGTSHLMGRVLFPLSPRRVPKAGRSGVLLMWLGFGCQVGWLVVRQLPGVRWPEGTLGGYGLFGLLVAGSYLLLHRRWGWPRSVLPFAAGLSTYSLFVCLSDPLALPGPHGGAGLRSDLLLPLVGYAFLAMGSSMWLAEVLERVRATVSHHQGEAFRPDGEARLRRFRDAERLTALGFLLLAGGLAFIAGRYLERGLGFPHPDSLRAAPLFVLLLTAGALHFMLYLDWRRVLGGLLMALVFPAILFALSVRAPLHRSFQPEEASPWVVWGTEPWALLPTEPSRPGAAEPAASDPDGRSPAEDTEGAGDG